MAKSAVGHCLPVDVWGMTFQAVWDLVMRRVTRYTRQLTVSASKFGNFLALFFMAGHAFVSRVARELQRNHRHVGISMTLSAVLQIKVWCAGVATRTGRYGVGSIGKMFAMTIKTGKGRIVAAAIARDLGLFIGMAFDTVRRIKVGVSLRHARQNSDGGKQNSYATQLYE